MLLASLNQLTTPGMLLLAQDQDRDWGNLIYLGVLALFGVLNWVVAKYKEWIGDKSGEGPQGDSSDGDVVYDVTLDDDEDFVLKPRQAGVPTQTPNRPAPPRQPTPPRAPVVPARPAQPVARPAPPTPRPAVAQPARARPASAPRQSQRTQTQSSSKKRSSQQTATRKQRAAAEVDDAPKMKIAGVPVRSLRDAVILSEVLAPPLAIRQMDGRGSDFDRPSL